MGFLLHTYFYGPWGTLVGAYLNVDGLFHVDVLSLSPSLLSFLSLPIALLLFCLLLAQIPFKAAKGVSYWYTSREEIVAILTVSKVVVDVYNIVSECLRDYISQWFFDQTRHLCALIASLLAASLSPSLSLKIVLHWWSSVFRPGSLLNFSETVFHRCSLWLRQN